MTDDTRSCAAESAGMADAEVRKLARRAISVIASNSAHQCGVVDQRLRLLCDAFLSDHEDPRHEAMLHLRQDGVTVTDIVDIVLPEVARILGRLWADDVISFADVTIGTARLQETVRALSMRHRAWADAHPADAANPRLDRPRNAASGALPRILLVIPRPEHHTFGTFVASEQFRRFGYDVDIALDKHPRQIIEMLRQRQYVMVGITAAGRRTLASARELVDIIRSTIVRVTPIVLGGSVLEVGGDLRQVTGVDFLARDARTALAKCGLDITEPGAPLEAVDVHAG